MAVTSRGMLQVMFKFAVLVSTTMVSRNVNATYGEKPVFASRPVKSCTVEFCLFFLGFMGYWTFIVSWSRQKFQCHPCRLKTSVCASI